MRLFVLLLAVFLCLPARAQSVVVYHAHWMGDAWRQYNLSTFTRIFFFDLAVGADGLLEHHGWPDRWRVLREQAARDAVPINPVVSVLGVQPFRAVFGDERARNRLLEDCIALAMEAGGVHLDVEVFEPLSPPEIAAFRDFLAALRRALDVPPRRHLSAFVPVSGDLYSAAELARLDLVVAQGYDVHWPDGPTAGPVAALAGESPAAWIPATRDLLAKGVARHKLYLSSPLYGYEWPVSAATPQAATRGPARIITYAPVSAAVLPDIRGNALARAREHGWRRDAASRAPWYQFREDDGLWQGWFDDPVSLRDRLAYLQEGGFGGVAFFVLGYDGGALVDTAREAFRGPAASARDMRRESVR